MIQRLLLVCGSFSVCAVLECSAGYPGSTSDGDNVSTLNNILMADGWKQLVTLAADRELKHPNGSKMDVSDLLSKGPDGVIVTPANYTDKLVKSSTAANCFYGENLKCINDFFVDIIAGQCRGLGFGEPMLDCVERFWQTMHINKSLIEKMLVALNFFHDASGTLCPRTVIDALECQLPHYDRRVYNKWNYLDANGAVKIDDFKRDYEYFLDKTKCANKIIRDFLVARCLPSSKGQEKHFEYIKQIKAALGSLPSQPTVGTILDLYVDSLLESEKTFTPKLGFDKE